jgi:hypothetical protein
VVGLGVVVGWWWTSRVRQRAKQHLGYYAPATRVVRNAVQDSFPSFLGVATRSPARIVRGRHRAS